MEFAVLGPIEVRDGERLVEIRRGIPRVLLSALVLFRGETVSFDRLIEHVWGDSLPANPPNALQTQIAYLRRVLGGTSAAPIVTRPTGYVLDVPPEGVDAYRFEDLATRARRLLESGTATSLERAVEEYELALRLWRGWAYADAADQPFAEGEANRLEQLRLQAMEERVEALLQLGRAAEAATDVGALVTAHPLRERFHEQLMLALYRTGRQAEALRAFEHARTTLAEELGLDPGPDLRRLERLILDQSPDLDWTPPAGVEAAAVVHASAASASAHAAGLHAGGGQRQAEIRPRLIGRASELARLADLLAETKVLTLTGPGGAGKTRLALELADAARGSRRVVVVDLSLVANDDDVALAVASASDVETSGQGNPVEEVVAALATTDALVVLDTCEHVLRGAALVAAAVAARCPAVTVLATSRHPLAIEAELAWPVPPLALPSPGTQAADSPAVQLFLERARAARADIEIDGDALDDVAAICRELDGLPLAIELAAAQCDALSPAAIRARLADRFSLLVAPVADARPAARQRTLRATIEWSVQLLDEADREFLLKLGVFSGSFDVDAAAAVAGVGTGEAVTRLVALTRASLVALRDGGRYGLLDSVRAFAFDELDPGAVRELRRRHAAHYASASEQAFIAVLGPAQRESMHTLRRDVGNLRNALDWSFGPEGDEQLGARLAGSLSWVWMVDGLLTEARRAVERAARVENAEPLVRARVLLGVGILAAPLGDLARAREACAESVELAAAAGDGWAHARGLITLGIAHWGLGELKEAAEAHDAALAIFDQLDNHWGVTVARVLRARTAIDAGEDGLAERLLDTAVEGARATGDAHLVGLAFHQHARLALRRGDFDTASVAASECLSAGELLGYREGIVAGLHVLGRARYGVGDKAAARSHWLRGLELASSISHVGAMCEALECLAALSSDEGDDDQAALLLLHAARLRDRRGVPVPASEADAVRALTEAVRGRVGQRWEGMERLVPLTSVDDVVASLLAPR